MFTHFAAGKVRRGQTMPENDALVQVVKMHPEILQQMLSTVLNIIMFEDCRNQWSMSRPLLGLILLNEDYFQQLRDQLIQSQAASKQNSESQQQPFFFLCPLEEVFTQAYFFPILTKLKAKKTQDFAKTQPYLAKNQAKFPRICLNFPKFHSGFRKSMKFFQKC